MCKNVYLFQKIPRNVDFGALSKTAEELLPLLWSKLVVWSANVQPHPFAASLCDCHSALALGKWRLGALCVVPRLTIVDMLMKCGQ